MAPRPSVTAAGRSANVTAPCILRWSFSADRAACRLALPRPLNTNALGLRWWPPLPAGARPRSLPPSSPPPLTGAPVAALMRFLCSVARCFFALPPLGFLPAGFAIFLSAASEPLSLLYATVKEDATWEEGRRGAGKGESMRRSLGAV